MTYILPITDLRRNIFSIVDRIARTGDAVDVEKEGKRIVRIIPVKHDAMGKAEYILSHVLPTLKGAWKDESPATKNITERNYWKRPIFS